MQNVKEWNITHNQKNYMVKNSFEHCLPKYTYKSSLEKIVNFTGDENYTNCEVMILAFEKCK